MINNLCIFLCIQWNRQYVLIALLAWFSVFGANNLIAQETANEEVKRVQRAIFIYNFAQQVGWPEIDEIDTFKIGVLGPDRTIIDLKSMAQKRKIFGKPVEIVRFQFVKSIKDVQLLYVHNKYNYDINYILGKISEKNILLVTEDYFYNSSMINMVNVGDSFEYEINVNRIKNEGFVTAPSLEQYAITSSQKWKGLFKTVEESLEKALDENEEQKVAIKDKEEQIKQQEEKISNQARAIDTIQGSIVDRNNWIEKLSSESKIQEKKYEEKLLIEKELERNIQDQVTFIKTQEKKIEASIQEIEKQQEYLEEQNEEIRKKEEILEQQRSEIDNQKKINWYLIALIALILIGGFFIYRSYLNKKRLNASLEEKNKEIHEQSLVLESKNKELEQFAYIASHDLQEPLNTISSFIGLISEDYGDSFDDIGKESLNFIKDASIRMKKLIDSLLEYSRLGRTRDFTKVDMNKIFSELKGDFKNILERTNAKIDSKKLPIINGNPVELRLLLQNLVSNGIKFIEDDIIPEIQVGAVQKHYKDNPSKKYWEFSVKDNGIGIPKIHQDRIFAIFQRLHSREKYQGTGIGLAHCKKIVESHNGEIWLESIEGKGTTFYFTIPE
ncbi:His Kinase A (phospho-acceptor) domain-containing protein [Aquimarina amphilecti]|uniref:histidine kinase n=1 Tax=Aquimarina amphilecti TaxID=1038014 RepID=A0A1H7QIK2_AQUAM|nr:YfiR/HmsC family protein [Aquimarina amphilecti]SEL47736.1 His Kinase A (phospho-acceptor) domain-containing protein [Aquimarina amphilecti]